MDLATLQYEVKYKTSKSSGSGGQNVNKVSTKVELLFDVQNTSCFTEDQKKLIYDKLANRIDSNGVFHIQCDETRSQLKNKTLVFERFINMITKAIEPVKKRKKTKPTKSSQEKRISNKKKQADKKRNRNFKIGD